MIDDFRSYVEDYYNKINIKGIDKLIDVCHNNNCFLKFILLTIKLNISIVSPKNNSDRWILKNKKQLLFHIHKRRRDLIKEHGKKIGDNGLKKNYSEKTDKLMESINNSYISMIKNMNSIDKILTYIANDKYNIDYCLKILERSSDIMYIEEYSNN